MGKVRGHWRTSNKGKRTWIHSYHRGGGKITAAGVVLVVVFVLVMVAVSRGG